MGTQVRVYYFVNVNNRLMLIICFILICYSALFTVSEKNQVDIGVQRSHFGPLPCIHFPPFDKHECFAALKKLHVMKTPIDHKNTIKIDVSDSDVSEDIHSYVDWTPVVDPAVDVDDPGVSADIPSYSATAPVFGPFARDDHHVDSALASSSSSNRVGHPLSSKLRCSQPGTKLQEVVGGNKVTFTNVVPLTKHRSSLWISDVETSLPQLAVYYPMGAMAEPQGTMVVGMCYVSSGDGETPYLICLGIWLTQCHFIFIIVYDTMTEKVVFLKHNSEEFKKVMVSHPELELPMRRDDLVEIYKEFCKTGKEEVMRATGKMSNYKAFTSDTHSPPALWVPYKDDELPGLFDLDGMAETYNRVHCLDGTILTVGDHVRVTGKLWLMIFRITSDCCFALGHKANKGRFFFAGVRASPTTFCWDEGVTYLLIDTFNKDRLVFAHPKDIEPVHIF